MISPARSHFQKAMAATVAAVATVDVPQTSDQYKLMLASLVEDRRRLHDIQSIERKIEAKREMLPAYAPYVEGVLEGGAGAQDDVLMTVMIWRIDIGDIDGALPIARYALQHKLNPPDQYKRTTAAIIAEEAADAVLRNNVKPVWEKGKIKNVMPPEDANPVMQQLFTISELTAAADMHDQIRAKLYKAYGYLCALSGRYADALQGLNRALELDQNCGVKKDIERLHPLVHSV